MNNSDLVANIYAAVRDLGGALEILDHLYEVLPEGNTKEVIDRGRLRVGAAQDLLTLEAKELLRWPEEGE